MRPEKDLILKCSNLSFNYYKDIILKKLNVSLVHGETLAVIGPNGGGKTTFIKLISGLLNEYPYKGEILISNQHRSRLKNLAFPIGYLPQKETLNLDLPIKASEVVFMGKKKDQSKNTSFTDNEVIEKLNIQDLLNHDFRTLSGGQRQRVMIARALLIDSPLVVFDEPAKGLDENAQDRLEEVINLIRERKKQSLIMIDHDIQRAIRCGDRILCLNKESHWHDHKNLIKQGVINKIYKCEISAIAKKENI